MKAIVFGANGYLGRNLVHYLKSLNWELELFDLQEVSPIEGVNYHCIDITHRENIKSIDYDVDFIFHFAGRTGTTASFTENMEFLKSNEIGLLNVLDQVKNLPFPPRIVFPSTRLVYKGKKDQPLQEQDEKEFKTIYAMNKYACEQYLAMYQALYKISYSVFRICVPYGNMVDNSYSYGTIGFFLTKAKNGNPITLYGDGLLKRTFTHVSDLMDQMISCIEKETSSCEVYNIGGETYSLLDVSNYIAGLFNVEVKHILWPEADLKIESGDTIFDAGKIKNQTDYELTRTLKSWIAGLK